MVLKAGLANAKVAQTPDKRQIMILSKVGLKTCKIDLAYLLRTMTKCWKNRTINVTFAGQILQEIRVVL
jgi:hypothetical protein